MAAEISANSRFRQTREFSRFELSFGKLAIASLPIVSSDLENSRVCRHREFAEHFLSFENDQIREFADIASLPNNDCNSIDTYSIRKFLYVLKSYDPNSFISDTFDVIQSHYHIENPAIGRRS